MTVDTVLFDLDGTLCEYRRPAADLLADAFEAVGVEPLFTVEEYFAIFDAFLEPDISTAQLRSNCFGALAGERGHDPELGHRVAEFYEAERDHTEVEYLPGALDVLEALDPEYGLGLITNGGPDMQRQKLAALDLERWFDTIVFAGHDCARKPEPDPFHLALENLGGRPGRSVFVGNSLEDDIAGAHAAGVTSIWVPATHHNPDPEPHHAFETLHELCDPPWLKDRP